jgi:hypothetical protein
MCILLLDLYSNSTKFLLNHFTFTLSILCSRFYLIIKNGIRIEKTRDEAQAQDAEKTLQNLKSEYISSTSCVHHAL